MTGLRDFRRLGRSDTLWFNPPMGLGLAFLRDLIELKRTGAIDGARRVVEIGAQQLADSLLTAPEFVQLEETFGRKPYRPDPVGEERFTDAAALAGPFWESLGFDHEAIDFAPGGLPLDLNNDQAPNYWRGAFDLIVNAGTTEHVANQENAFRCIHDLARVGAVMYHEVPAGGMMNHGLLNYNPKFFILLAEQNLYQVLFLRTYSHPPSAVPDMVRNMNRRYSGGVDHFEIDQVPDLMLRVALRKRFDRPFASPLDIPNSARSTLGRAAAALRIVRTFGLGGRGYRGSLNPPAELNK